MSTPTTDADGNPVYMYRPSLLGAPWAFTLKADAIEWAVGRRTGRVRYGDIRRVRMAYRPVNMQSYRFATELWADGTPKLQIVSISWKSMVQQERLDETYSAFVRELHRRIAKAGAKAVFLGGINPAIYWLGVAVFSAVCLGLCVLIVRAFQADAKGGAAFIAAFLGLFLWQGGDFLRRNKPGHYTVDALPQLLLPKA